MQDFCFNHKSALKVKTFQMTIIIYRIYLLHFMYYTCNCNFPDEAPDENLQPKMNNVLWEKSQNTMLYL